MPPSPLNPDPEPHVPELLFASDALIVRHVPAADARRRVVTFDCYDTHGTLDRPGFGEAFFQAHGITATHVLSRANDWYQHAEMPEALAAVRRRAAGAERLTTYGSSMGGYAAIRFADAVGAHAALALSPQYSIDPLKAPFEWRWQQEAHRIRFLPELDGPIRSAVTPVIVYDPTTLDRAHVDRIAADIPVARLRVPHSGHPVGPYLSEGELLTSLVLDMIHGTLDIAATEQAVRARRREIITYLAALARAQPAARPRLAIRIARHAVALNPDHPLALLTLADRLRAAELLDEAIAVHRHLAAVSNRHPTYLFPFSMTLAADEQVDEALALAREVQQGWSDVAGAHHWVAVLLARKGHWREALAAAEDSIRLDPANRFHAQTLAGIRAQLRRPFLSRIERQLRRVGRFFDLRRRRLGARRLR